MRGARGRTRTRSGSSMLSIRRKRSQQVALVVVGRPWRIVHARLAPQPRPAVILTAIDVCRLAVGLFEELRKRRPGQSAQVVDERLPLRQPRRVAQVPEHDLVALAVELDVTAGRKERESRPPIARRSGPRRRSTIAPSRRSNRNSRCCCPIRSITVRYGLPSARRRPRPSCWVKTVALSVGRSSSTVSTLGTSTPSPSTSTEKTTRKLADLERSQGRCGLGLGVWPDSARTRDRRP